MTDERFEELINLYLDNEIGRRDLGDLKGAIKDNLVRRRKFEHACQVHQAARKALADRAQNEKKPTPDPRQNGPGPGSPAQARKARLVQAPLGTPAGAEQLVHRQQLAQRNAAVSSLAERQVVKGAASTVDLHAPSSSSRRSVPKESSTGGSSSGTTSTLAGEGTMINFFDSAAGMLVSGFLILVLGFVIFAAFQASGTSPGDDDGSTPKNTSGVQVIPHQEATSEFNAAQERLAAEARGRPVKVDDALGPQVFQAALSESSGLGWVPVDYSVSHTDSPSNNGTMGDVSTTLSTQTSQNMLLAPTTVTIGGSNSTGLNITIPDLTNQSTPSLLPDGPSITPAPLDDPDKSDNTPGPTVIMP